MSCTPCKIYFDKREDWEAHLVECTKTLVQEKQDVNEGNETTKKESNVSESTPKKTKEEAVIKSDDLNQTINDNAEENKVKPKKIKADKRFYQCGKCKKVTNIYNEHVNHRLACIGISGSILPTKNAPLQLKRKKSDGTPKKTYQTNKYKCEKCHFTTLYKYNLPQHMKRIHGKCPKTNLNNSDPLTKTASIDSSSYPPSKVLKKEDKNTEQDNENAELMNIDENSKVGSIVVEVEMEQFDLRTRLNILRQSENYVDNSKILEAKKNEEYDQDLEAKDKEVEELSRRLQRAGSWKIESDQRAAELIKENQELKSKLEILQIVPNKLETELKSKEKEHVHKIKQIKDERNAEHENLKQQLETKENELKQVREKVDNQEKRLKEYEEIINEAERKYETNHKQTEALKKDNEEMNNNMGLLKRALKVTEEKLKSKLELNEDNDVETPNIENIISNKNSGYERPNPQSKPEPKQTKKTNVIHICEQCGKQFAQEKHMKTHTLNHNSDIGSHACSQCCETFSNKQVLDIHTKTHEDGDHNCVKCDFQGNSKEALIKHKTTKHVKKSELICKFCETKFSFRYQLTSHILENHGTYKPCSNYEKNKCEFDSECRFNHIIIKEGSYICFECGNIFNNKTLMMKHIGEQHGSILCNKFASGRCTYGNRCIYKHEAQEPTQSRTNQTNNPTQGFQGTPPNTAPPNWPGLPQNPHQNQPQNQMIQITTMMTMMEQNMTLLKNMVKNITQ